jgi:hypothetical protein
LLGLLLGCSGFGPAKAEPIALPQPTLLPSASPLCNSSLVPCLDIDDLAGHAYAHLIVLPKTELAQHRRHDSLRPVDRSVFGRLSAGLSSHTSFFSQSGEDLRSQGPLRLSATLRLWPLLPLHSSTPSALRLGITYDHELRLGPFDGANSLGLLGNLSAVRVVAAQSLGLFELSLSVGALARAHGWM